MSHLTHLSTLGVLAAVLLLAPTPTWAGCGCDHPPPDWAQVMPPFGSPGRVLTLTADGFALQVGEPYKVDFGSADVTVVAQHDDRLEVALPSTVGPGPVEIKVIGPGIDHTYPDSLFTALPPARHVEERSGLFAAWDYEAAIGADGTLYLALDVSDVKDAMQFTFALHELPLHFEHDDVVIYNADGVDLTLFTLEVTDATERQWGSYYGWSVESDAGLHHTWYVPKSMRPSNADEASSVFTYWRHEFHTYADAHAPGGSHEVDANGLHPDGTRHVDHDSLIIAIQGAERDTNDPLDRSKDQPLSPGKRQVDVGWLSFETSGPLELDLLAPLVASQLSPDLARLLERHRDDD
ncbi:MAG: hypothetical protein ACQGVC_11400 [Myxococcota bacterium]